MAVNTPPPNQYQHQQPPNTNSPAPSAHSQAPSSYPTPQIHAQPPPHSQSPLANHQTGPSPLHQSTPDMKNRTKTSRQSQEVAYTPGYTIQQQQQMAAAMNIFGQAVQAQGQGPASAPAPAPPQAQTQPQSQTQPQPSHSQGESVRPPVQNNNGMGTGMVRPPPSSPFPGMNPAEFPFDYRIIPALAHASNPRWQADVGAKNPQFAQAVNQAQQMINDGVVSPDTLQKMHQFHATITKMSQGRPLPSTGNTPFPSHMSQPSPAGPGNRRDSSGTVRPPPPPHTVPESPAEDRPSSSRGKVSTPTENMPPPAWIPGQPTPNRPPPTESRPHVNSLPVKEWEGHIRLDLPITQISTLPEETDDPTFDGKLPSMSEEEVKSVLEWMEADKSYAGGMVDRKKAVQKKMFKWARNNDIDTPWWSVRKGERYMPPRTRLQIIFPRDKDVQRMRKSHKGRRYTK